MKRSVCLRALLLLSLNPLFQTSSNLLEVMVETHPEVSVEGQFLASLTPFRSGGEGCACTSGATMGDSAHVAGLTRDGEELRRESSWEGDERHGGQFWRVMLHDDDVHTLSYAIDTVDKVLSEEGARTSPGRRRVAVQWAAYQAHHYGLGTVAVLPEEQAHRVQQGLDELGLGSTLVAN
ncbi:hypothetical protein T484DRAFT_1957228 [Baffinella frigidus]|nr:hypothetical protein T484DRAFT_1957228 [Cryptophyta sp. CCMP2293]